VAIDWTTLTASKSTAGSIANWVNRSDLPTENILLEAEAWIYLKLRCREMLIRDTAFQFDSGSQSEALPSGFLDPLGFWPYGYTDPLLYVHEEILEEQRDSDGTLLSGTPSRWAVIGETAYVDVQCSANYPGVLMYYKQPDALSASNETNFLTRRYPSLLRMACMAHAYEHMKDTPRAREYLGLAMAKLEEARQADDLFRRTQNAPAY
jgi:hypothetical protein